MWYLFTATGFPRGGKGRWTCTEVGKGQLDTKGQTIHKTIQEHRIRKIENRHTKQANKHKKNNENVSLVVRNYKEQQIIMRTCNYTEPTYGYVTIREW
jgi:hypothetical protein